MNYSLSYKSDLRDLDSDIVRMFMAMNLLRLEILKAEITRLREQVRTF